MPLAASTTCFMGASIRRNTTVVIPSKSTSAITLAKISHKVEFTTARDTSAAETTESAHQVSSPAVMGVVKTKHLFAGRLGGFCMERFALGKQLLHGSIFICIWDKFTHSVANVFCVAVVVHQ